MDTFPSGYRLPGLERLQELGTTFTNHHINSCVCTSSRSVIYTGQHIQHTRMFDNITTPWTRDLSLDLPTIGHMLRERGYYTAYQGKWHLSKGLEESESDGEGPQLTGREELDKYGFSDYVGVGDIIGHQRGGYLNDQWVAAVTRKWLRERGAQINAQGQPWFLAVNFVNPHDVMYFNTDLPGEEVQGKGSIGTRIAPAPDHEIYRQEWEFDLPETRHERADAPGRPPAHDEFQRARGILVGRIPDEDDRWRRLVNYYLNCIQDCDRNVKAVVDEVEALGLLDRSIIVRTSDHGELAGAHGMSGKGATAYREQNHVPMVVVHPDVAGGRKCAALTTHLDIVPSILSMAGNPDGKERPLAEALKGRDFSTVLRDPQAAPVDAVRDAALYAFNMIIYNDANFIAEAGKTLQRFGPLRARLNMLRRRLRPDLKKRGAIRTVFDGRYAFSRYFSPREHHVPDTFETLTMLNDLELYDRMLDPLERNNLASDPEKNRELVLAMNDKLNRIIADEVGPDDGEPLPLSGIVDYAFTTTDI